MNDDDATIDLTRPVIEPSGARIFGEMRLCVACPACGEKAGRIDHLYSDDEKLRYRGRSQSVGPWVCDDCGAGYRVIVSYDDFYPDLKPGNIAPRVTVERAPEHDHVDTLTMLYFPVTDAGRLIVSGRRLASDKVGYGQRYFYDEHTCTLNLLQGNVELVMDDDDTDPHGLFVYVATIDWPDDLDLDALSAREIRALFEVAPTYGGDDSATLTDDDGLEFAPEPPPLVFDLQPSGHLHAEEGVMADTFACAACGGTFHKGWSDEEKRAEAEDLFGDIPEAERVTVCDDCFQAMERQRVAEGIPLEAFRDGRDPFATRPIPNDE